MATITTETRDKRLKAARAAVERLEKRKATVTATAQTIDAEITAAKLRVQMLEATPVRDGQSAGDEADASGISDTEREGTPELAGASI